MDVDATRACFLGSGPYCLDHRGDTLVCTAVCFHPKTYKSFIPLHCVSVLRMLQTFTAEKLNDHGFGRQTFALEMDLYPKHRPCLVFESQLSVGEVHQMTGIELWTYFARELMSTEMFKADRNDCKWFAFMSFTRYCVPPSTNPPSSHSEVVSLTKGHTALGMHCILTYTKQYLFDC